VSPNSDYQRALPVSTALLFFPFSLGLTALISLPRPMPEIMESHLLWAMEAPSLPKARHETPFKVPQRQLAAVLPFFSVIVLESCCRSLLFMVANTRVHLPLSEHIPAMNFDLLDYSLPFCPLPQSNSTQSSLGISNFLVRNGVRLAKPFLQIVRIPPLVVNLFFIACRPGDPIL